jgi:hypothetical protein
MTGIYGSSESVGLYGNTVNFGGTYFEWFIFQESATAPATPTGGSWNFTTNVGVPPAGWTTAPPVNPTNTVWASISIVNSRSSATLTWTAPASWVKQGPAGTAATIAAGTTTTGAAGTSATVTNAGTSSAAVFNFTIPRGDTGVTGATGATGAAATVGVGTTTTGAPGSSANVTNSGTTSAATFNFTIPRGDVGATGATGATGSTGATGTAATIAAGTTTTGAAGSSATVTNAGTSSAAVFNFTIPQGNVGATGATGAQGVPGINWLGAWNSGTTYAIRDGVSYNGSSYYAIAASTNQVPTNTSFWDVLAEKGANGSGSGTVTSVGLSAPAVFTVSGSPVTGSGTLALSYSGTALPVLNGGTGVTTSTGTGSVVLNSGATLTSPIVNQINDTNNAQILGLSPTASAVDYLVVKNGVGVGVPLHVYADGASANTGLHIQPKGTGLVTISDGTDFNKGIRFRSSSSAASAVTLLDAVSTAGRVVTLPDATTTLVGRDTTDTLTNKTIAFGSNTFSGALPIVNGGTGQATAAAAITALTGTQTNAYYLRSNGTNATLSGLAAADLTGTVAIASGGTGQSTASAGFNALSPVTTTGDLIIGNGANSATRLPIGANTYVLTSDGSTASWAASTGGVTSFSAGSTGLTPATGTTGAVSLAGTLIAANGGTGLSSPSTAGNVLTSTGTGWVSSAPAASGLTRAQATTISLVYGF